MFKKADGAKPGKKRVYYFSAKMLKISLIEILIHILYSFRAAEIIFTLAHAHSKHHVEFIINECYRRLLVARKELALFQHHDAITGTARDHVVVDYGQRMLRSIQDSVRVMELSTNYLLTKFKEDYKEELNNVPVIHFGESREHFDQIPIKKVVIISDQPSFVVLYNSLAQERMQVVSVHVSEPYLEVCKIMPLFCFYVKYKIFLNCLREKLSARVHVSL